MNGNSGITPTVELATTNGNNGFRYPYPVMPFYGANGNDGFFGDSGIWAIILLALLFGNGGWGGFGGFGEVAINYPNNIILCTMNGHICCIKYGIIYDTFNPSNRIVEEAWIVK